MNCLFLMDPLEGVHYEKDTSFALMLGCQGRGHHVFYVPKDGLTLEHKTLLFHAKPVIPRQDPDHFFEEGPWTRLSADDVDVVFIRTDPPFDGRYLMNTWLLDYAPKRVFIMNSPAGIRSANEKLWAMQFSEITPPALASSNKGDLLEFLAQQQDIIVKPTDGYGGQGVFRLRLGEANCNVILETLTEKFTRTIIVQKFIPESAKGDKRILLLDGEPLGAVLRLHSPDDHRNNFFSGGKPYPADLTSRDNEIIALLRPKLKSLGLTFVGIDILGDFLIEVNVTSPTCLQEMNRLYDQHLEDAVIRFVEAQVAQRKNI